MNWSYIVEQKISKCSSSIGSSMIKFIVAFEKHYLTMVAYTNIYIWQCLKDVMTTNVKTTQCKEISGKESLKTNIAQSYLW